MSHSELFQKTDRVIISCETPEQMANALNYVKLVEVYVGCKVNKRPYFNWIVGSWYGYAMGRFNLGLNIKR